MFGVRVNPLGEAGLGEPEQDANSALTELDKGLRSGKVGEQCEAIVRFPRLFEKYPFPILINSSFLKLADVFRVGNNFLRLWVLRVCQQSEKHLDKILNVDEFVRRIFSVIHSNDPVARALTLRTLGSVAGIIPEREQVHHSIRRSLDSHDSVEVEAAIYASMHFAAQSKSFAVTMCNKISQMIQGLATPAHMKLQLIPILQYMHHDTSTAAMVRQLCTDLLPKYPAQEFVLVTIKTLTQLASATLVEIPNQVELLLQYLVKDPRCKVQFEAMQCLYGLAKQGAHLWPEESVASLVKVARESPHQALVGCALDVLIVLTKSPAVCQAHAQPGTIWHQGAEPCGGRCCWMRGGQLDPPWYHDMCFHGDTVLVILVGQSSNTMEIHLLCHRIKDSILMELCQETCYSSNPDIAVKAVRVITQIFCYSYTENLPTRGIENSVEVVEGLFLLVLCMDESQTQVLRSVLQCAVSLCKVQHQLIPHFVKLFASSLVKCADWCAVLLCEALGAIGGMQQGAVSNFLPSFISKLCELNDRNEQSHTQIKVMLCTLIFQSLAAVCWNDDAQNAINGVIQRTNFWAGYRIARSAARYGHFGVCSTILKQLHKGVSSEHLHFWIIMLKEMSQGEASLKKNNGLLQKIEDTVSYYCKALAAIKAASTPVQSLMFQAEYMRLRCEMLTCMAQLVATCNSFCTAPPPAIAAAIVQSTRDDLQRFGHITNQLRKSAKEFHACGELYWRLYQSAFDADPGSLKNIQILQHMCTLMAYNIECVALPNYEADEPALDLSLQNSTLEIQLMVRSCARISAAAHAVSKAIKPITHHHILSLLKQVEVFTESPLCMPRYFFQVLQSTSVKLAITPQPRVNGEWISVPSGSQLAVKVEGVIQHGARPGLFRSISGVVLTLSSQLTSRVNPDTKPGETGVVLKQSVTPHRDFFTAQFLLALGSGGQHQVIVEAAVEDKNGNVWNTGPRTTLAVKAHEDPSSSKARTSY